MTKNRQKCKGLGPEHPLTVTIEMQKTQGTNKTAMFKKQKEGHDWRDSGKDQRAGKS